MSIRRIATVALTFSLLGSVASLAGQAPAARPPQPASQPDAAAAAAASGQAPNNPAANQYSVNQNFGDWTVRCVLTTIKVPAPCDMMQLTVNKDNQQRISSFSLTWVPSRDTYALQVIVPTGVALGKGLNLAAGDKSLNAARFTRCERDGCYMEMLTDPATVNALGAVGASTTITVVGYGNNNEIKLPVSMTGFKDALDRMKGLARERAIPLPANVPLGPASTVGR